MVYSIGNPEEVETLARSLRTDASSLGDLYDASTTNLGDTDWVGRRAAETKSLSEGQAATIDDLNTELKTLAKALDDHANWIIAEKKLLSDLESRIRAWASVHPPDPLRPGPDSSLVTPFPEPYDPRWRALGQRLRAAGESF